MKPITVWLRFDGLSRAYVHNHIEDGHVPYTQGMPTAMCEEQRRNWQGQEWVRRYRWLDDEARIVDRAEQCC